MASETKPSSSDFEWHGHVTQEMLGPYDNTRQAARELGMDPRKLTEKFKEGYIIADDKKLVRRP